MASNEDIARFLHYISQMESSGGKNPNHKVIESGIHAGDAAEGQYGVMPNTMQELDSRFPASFTEESSPDDYAKQLAQMVLDKSKNNETLAAGLWNQGHNASPEKYPEIEQSGYAQKFEKLRKQIPQSLDPNPYYAKEPEQSQPDFVKLKELLKK